MSTKAQAIMDEILGLPPKEVRELWQQSSRMAAAMEMPNVPTDQVSDREFEAALAEVTGCTKSSLQRLLEERRRDRERDEAWLEARKRERNRGGTGQHATCRTPAGFHE